MVTQLTVNSIAVEVEATAYNFKIPESLSILWYQLPPLRGYLPIDLPEGSWQILGRSEQITEEQADQIVGRRYGLPFLDEEMKKGTPYYFNYEAPLFIPPNWEKIVDYSTTIKTALESFESLLKSKNISPDNVIILIKQ